MTKKEEKINEIIDIKFKNDPSVSEQTKQWLVDILKSFSNDLIERELKKAKRTQIPPPELLDDSLIDLKPLRKKLKEYINWISSNDNYEDSGWEEDIYQIVMEMYFGKEIWDYFKKI